MDNPPLYAWTRKLDAEEPCSDIHTFSRPPILEALSLLPVAYRVGTYIVSERYHRGREPIFDLNGIDLKPPHPGPYGGVPCGGLGSGSIGRGFRGDFRRWSIHPGRYGQRVVDADQFSVRVKRMDVIESVVLSVVPPCKESTLTSWNFKLPAGCATFHGLHPRSWIVYENPLPGIRVIVRQVSPFIPHSYSDSSLPCCLFHVEVENTGDGDIEASVMFTFQNGDGGESDDRGNHIHVPFLKKFDPIHHKDSPDGSSSIFGVCMSHSRKGINSIPDAGSFSTAVLVNDIQGSEVTFCNQFVSHQQLQASGLQPDNSSLDDIELRMQNNLDKVALLWKQFTDTGGLFSSMSDQSSIDNICNISRENESVACAICVKQIIQSKKTSSVSFSLSWDFPIVRFGSDSTPVPRFYTRFFGKSGFVSPHIAVYGLVHGDAWEEEICRWQDSTINGLGSTEDEFQVPEYFHYHLFNELYYLVDGGSIWCDSRYGIPNEISSSNDESSFEHLSSKLVPVGSSSQSTSDTPTNSTDPLISSSGEATDDAKKGLVDRDSSLCYVMTMWTINMIRNRFLPNQQNSVKDDCVNHYTEIQNTIASLSVEFLWLFRSKFLLHDSEARNSGGNQSIVGQFLYLEGHEYLMYNTYDVHFYSSFSLLMLWPELELSIQRDFGRAVFFEDTTMRRMMGEGYMRPRKTKGIVPHDLGSPSEAPWVKTNAYNFQDVSSWKDLGPKFVLQILRDYVYLTEEGCDESQTNAKLFLQDMYPVCLLVMTKTQEFDLDGDGMIENSGFPDQTYDIWKVKGVSAYCGGLWVASCSAMALMAKEIGDECTFCQFNDLSIQARKVYLDSLWNGRYLNYDSSNSKHSKSVMADMLAGHWFSLCINLHDPVIPDSAMVCQCLSTIFTNNVLAFGKGSLIGAVNGMNLSTGDFDNSCLQSREVWTGTTYGLAACMMMEALRRGHQSDSSDGKSSTAISEASETSDEHRTQEYLLKGEQVVIDTPKAVSIISSSTEKRWQFLRPFDKLSRNDLYDMAYITAQGIHDGGWEKFGYWYATPEAWEANGNYRSLGYMRPLSIWAMQFAREKMWKQRSQEKSQNQC